MTITKFQPVPSPKFFTNNFFDEFFQRGLSDMVGADSVLHQPAVNVVETPDAFKLELAAPGFEKPNFQINVENDHLTISGQREDSQMAEGEKVTRREFRYASFQRSFKLPKTVNHEAIAAVYENGILNITIPKKEEAKPVVKTITVG
ncbi:MAG TPA: Hsp20/alpha crystallin family protein [Saprospiraceae bacterium]|nr:Hsp20/alpha crystallin family protein [Saprospiraceae bacterium]HND89592.1 Hsp20/alpha crystallin family protein [Saprospiraceae bacterium]